MMAGAFATKPDPGAQRLLRREDRGAVALITLNRPESRNSLSEELLIALREAFGELSASTTVRSVVLTGAPPAFCAGHDLRELTAHRMDLDRGRGFFSYLMRLCSEVMLAIMSCPKPVIAAVNGAASAAGCQLVASCDLAVAAEHASFTTPGVNIGLFCSTPMVALTRNVAPKHAMEMLLLGEPITAARAAEIGLVNRVAPASRLIEDAMSLADSIAAKASETVKFGKEAFYRQLEMPVAEAYAYAAKVMTENMLARDAEEGINAFLEKRPAKWSDGS
jgi:enoyl-CoA hydratase/carnithine racemase